MKLWSNEKKLPKEGEDYELLDIDGNERISAIRVLKGKFKGIVYYYGKVKVVEENEARLQFNYFVVHEGGFKLKDLHHNKKFDTLMGDILVSIVDNNILKKDENINDESFRIIDTEKSDL